MDTNIVRKMQLDARWALGALAILIAVSMIFHIISDVLVAFFLVQVLLFVLISNYLVKDYFNFTCPWCATALLVIGPTFNIPYWETVFVGSGILVICFFWLIRGCFLTIKFINVEIEKNHSEDSSYSPLAIILMLWGIAMQLVFSLLWIVFPTLDVRNDYGDVLPVAKFVLDIIYIFWIFKFLPIFIIFFGIFIQMIVIWKNKSPKLASFDETLVELSNPFFVFFRASLWVIINMIQVANFLIKALFLAIVDFLKLYVLRVFIYFLRFFWSFYCFGWRNLT